MQDNGSGLRREAAVLVSALTIALSAVVLGQSAVRESASISLVEIPVTVADRAGAAIEGLRADAFHVLDDGKPASVESLDVVDFNSPSTSQGRLEPSAARRRFLLLFDLSYSTPPELLRIRDAAQAFVENQLRPGDMVGVATSSVKTGVRLLLTFTPDRSQAVAAIRTLGITNQQETGVDPLQLSVTDPFTGNAPIDAGKETDDIIAAYLRDEAAYRQGRVEALLQSLGAFARALRTVPGQKQVIYFSQGFDARLLQGNSTDADAQASQNAAAAHGQIWRIDGQRRYGSSGLQASLNDVLEQFKRSGCLIHAIDLAGLQGHRDPSDSSGGTGKEALFAMARGTGGTLFENGNDFDEQLGRLLKAQRVTYVLTIRTRSTGKPGKWHVLKVKVDHPGAAVIARTGYEEPRPFEATMPLERRLMAADLIATEGKASQLAVHALGQAQPGKPGSQLAALVALDGKQLASSSALKTVPLEIYGYLIDPDGKVADFFSENLSLDLAKVGPRLESGGLLVYTTLQAPPGDYRLQVLVRRNSDGAVGSVVVPASVPRFGDGPPRVMPPLFIGQPPSGIVVRAASGRRKAEPPFPFQLGSERFLPEAAPVLGAGVTVRICVTSYGFGTSAMKFAGQVLDQNYRVLEPAELGVIGRLPADIVGGTTDVLSFRAGQLVPGAYFLRVLAQGESPGSAAQAMSPFEVR